MQKIPVCLVCYVFFFFLHQKLLPARGVSDDRFSSTSKRKKEKETHTQEVERGTFIWQGFWIFLSRHVKLGSLPLDASGITKLGSKTRVSVEFISLLRLAHVPVA